MYSGQNWPVFDVAESDFFTIDFVKPLLLGETISTVTATLEAVIGIDNAAASHLVGSAAISGTQVSQLVSGGIEDVTYRLTFKIITSQNRVLVRWSQYPCEDASDPNL